MCNLNKRTWEVATRFLERAQEEHKGEYDKRCKVAPNKVEVGMRAYVKRLAARKHKLQTRFLGPFRVLKVCDSGIQLRCIKNNRVIFVHKDYVTVVPESLLTPDDNSNVRAPFPAVEDVSDVELVMSE